MKDSTAQVFLYGLLAGTATVIDSLFVLYRAGGERKDLYRLMAFASGVLLGAAFVHLIPEAMEQARRPAAWGFVIRRPARCSRDGERPRVGRQGMYVLACHCVATAAVAIIS